MALARPLSSVGRWCLNSGSTASSRIAAAMLRLQENAGQPLLRPSDMQTAFMPVPSCSSSLSSLATFESLPWRSAATPHGVASRLLSTASSSNSATPNSGKADGGDAKSDGAAAAGAEQEAAEGEQATADATAGEEPKALLEEKDRLIAELQEKVAAGEDKLLRSLADMENLRQRTAREVENTQKYAVQKFAKSLLDVADTLERAYESVPEPVRKGESGGLDLEKAAALLKGVVQGVQMTSNVLLQVLKQHGIEQYHPLGAKFDPNLHSALFEVPDPNKEAGTIAVVTKRGYRMYDRVVRPAEVGVVKAP